MKRNLSSHAIRAMAIGMALTMASSTVMAGSVVNAYAMDIETKQNTTTTSAEVTNDEPTIIKITFEENVTVTDTSSTINDKFTVNVADSPATINTVAADDSNPKMLKITLQEAITEKQTVEVTYTTSDDDSKVTLASGSEISLSKLPIDNKVDTTAPTLDSAKYSASGSTHTITLTADEALKALSLQKDGGFTIANKGTKELATVNGVNITESDTSVVLTLSGELAPGDYTITYKKPGEGTEQIKDLAGNALEGATYNLNVPAQPPATDKVTLSKATYSNKIITLTGNDTTTGLTAQTIEGGNIATSGFDVKIKNGASVKDKISKIDVNDGAGARATNTITLTMTEDLAAGTYTVEYNNGTIENLNNTTTPLEFTVAEAPVEENALTFTDTNGTYHFEKVSGKTDEVALVGFTEKSALEQAQSQVPNKFVGGILTTNKASYKLTTIGGGSALRNATSLTTITDDALKGHTDYVTTIKENAFQNNTTIENVSFPNVTKVEAGAFSGATNLTTVDLGSKVSGSITITDGAFNNNENLTTVTTSPQNQQTVANAVKESGSNKVVVDVEEPVTEDNYNATNASIRENAYYITKDGLKFKGLSNNTLTFIGKGTFTAPTVANSLNGSKDKPYFVTYDNGIVSLKAGDKPAPPVEVEDLTVKSGNNTLTFEKIGTTNNVALVSITGATGFSSVKEAPQNTLENGQLKTNTGKVYTFTQIGTGTTICDNITDANTVLNGNLNNVTTVSANAFKGTGLTSISLPAVTTIGADAFANTSSLTEVYLGDNANNITSGAFTNAGGVDNGSLTITTNSNTVKEAIKDSGIDESKISNAAPFVLSAEVKSENTIVLTLSENVNVKGDAGKAVADDLKQAFKVKIDSDEIVSQKSVVVSQNIITITLPDDKKITSSDKVQYSYTDNGNLITDNENAKLENITYTNVINNLKPEITTTSTTESTTESTSSDTSTSTTESTTESTSSDTSTSTTESTTESTSSDTSTSTTESTTESTSSDTSTSTTTSNVQSNYNLRSTSSNSETTNGSVISITSTNGASEEDIQKMLTSSLEVIETGAFNNSTTLTLNFANVNISILEIQSGAFAGTGTIKITGLENNTQAQVDLANKLKASGNTNVKINTPNGEKTPDQIIEENNGGDNGGDNGNNRPNNGGSWSGGSGGGASIGNAGTSTDSNNNNNSGNNNGGTVVVEDKELSLDVINLPSVTGEPKVFADVPANHWAKSYIDKLSTAGIINGANGMFNPNGQTKRADVTIMLVNLLGLTPETNNKFADVNPAAYYAPYVGTASTYGIVNGSNGMFNPEGIISRQDTMVMIAQILKGLDLNVNTDTTALSKFSDASKVSPYANESVAILINSGIISGNNGKLNPTAPVTRAEMATIMSKLYDVLDAAK